MASEHAMIEPFVAEQVRMVGDRKVISFGTSSYGYDVRCASHFKVFTNIYSATVDPKAFDERSFVDIEDDVCIIPPNSFALARGGVNYTVFGGENCHRIQHAMILRAIGIKQHLQTIQPC